VTTSVGVRPPTLSLPWPHAPFGCGLDEHRPQLDLVQRRDAQALEPPRDAAARAAYRWLLGHHIAFCIWRVLQNALQQLATDGVTTEGLLCAAAWYDRYSAIQVYAGSCTPQLYGDVIRPSMVECDPAFSGAWARDYQAVLQTTAALDLPIVNPLKDALKRHRRVHMTLAKLLVPEGESLLKQAGKRPTDDATEAECDRFDTFFGVERRPVTAQQFQAQLLRRVTAAWRDLAATPLSAVHAAVLTPLPIDLSTCLRDIAAASTDRHLLEGSPWTSTSTSA
jgi:hypothetical protein